VKGGRQSNGSAHIEWEATDISSTQDKITGASRGFEHACYAVEAHGDGTGTVILDWYETSIGRDFMNRETFMRAEIETARQIVRLLNQKLPGRVDAITEYPPPQHESDPRN
jgi:hypothetical protein